MFAEDPFEFHGSDSQEDHPIIVRKTPPTIKKTPPSAKRTPNIDKKKTPRLVISKNNDEINEMLDIKRAIEESKKTALQEERARRYNNRLRGKDNLSSTSIENDGSTPSKHRQETAKPIEKPVGEGKGVRETEKHSRPQREASPCASENVNDVSSPSGGQHSAAVQQASTPVGVGPSFSRESTPTLDKTPTKIDSPISTPSKKNSSVSNSGYLSTRNRLALKRKRIPSISKEPSIKLFKVDTDSAVKKAKPVQQKSAKESCETVHNDTIKDDTAIDGSHKSTGTNSSTPTTFHNEEVDGKEKALPKPSETKPAKRRKTIKTTKEKSKVPLSDTLQCHVKQCPSMYAPHGTNARDYLPVILRVFEEFKRQLKMAQSECVTFIPWSAPFTTSKKDWQVNKDDGKSSANNASSPLVLSSPCSPAVERQQKVTKSAKEMVEADSLWNWDCAFDSDDQRLFYDSDRNVDPKSSQATAPPQVTTTSPICELVEQSTPVNKDISIDISSSNSNASSIIHHGRRKRKQLSRKIVGSSDVTFTGSKQSSSSRQSVTSSLPRGPIHHSLSSSPNISDNDDEPEEPTTQFPNKKSVIDLTEVEERAEVDSHESPSTSQEKRATCPVCQQLFSKEYIAIHAADCELHVDSESDDGGGRILPRASLSSSSKLRQTTLTRKLSSSNTLHKNIIESESDDVEVTPPPKKRKTRKLLTDKSRKTLSVHSKESDTEDNHVQLQKNYLTGTSLSTAVNTIFKSASVVGQAVDDINSYSSENDLPNPDDTTPTIIDYKNQFSATSAGKVSKELLLEDNEAFILTRQNKWMNAKKGKATGKDSRQKRWRRFKGKGKRNTKH